MYRLDCWRTSPKIDGYARFGFCRAGVPARFDFIGGWTDTPPYYFEHEAQVLNATLYLPEERSGVSAQEEAITVEVSPAERLAVFENGAPVDDPDQHIVIRNTLKFLSLAHPPLRISIANSIPKGSGLGGSSLLTASILSALLGACRGVRYVRDHLCELVGNVLLIEQMMGSGGGWQDQIGGIFPGVKLIGVSPSDPCRYSIAFLERSAEELSRHSLIIDTRIQRKAARILCSIRQKFLDRDPRTLETLQSIAANARLGFHLLEGGNIRDFAALLSESWARVNAIESGSIEPVERIRRICGNDLYGMKIGGAGGGGFILAILSDPDARAYFRQRIREEYADCLIYAPVFGVPGLVLSHPESDDPPVRIGPVEHLYGNGYGEG